MDEERSDTIRKNVARKELNENRTNFLNLRSDWQPWKFDLDACEFRVCFEEDGNQMELVLREILEILLLDDKKIPERIKIIWDILWSFQKVFEIRNFNESRVMNN